MAAGAIRVAFPTLVRALGHIRIPIFNGIRKRANRITSYAITSIKRYENLLESDPKKAPQSVFSKTFKAVEEDKMTFQEITANAMSLIVAGSDTTANTLTYLTWEVCRHPEVKQQLLQELQTLPADYNEGDLRQLPYLDHVINETLRVHSIAPALLPRVVPPEGANIAGHWLNGGTVIATQAYTMHRSESIFPDAETFNPLRWADTTKDMKDSFMPFGRGSRSKRNCICRRFEAS